MALKQVVLGTYLMGSGQSHQALPAQPSSKLVRQ